MRRWLQQLAVRFRNLLAMMFTVLTCALLGMFFANSPPSSVTPNDAFTAGAGRRVVRIAQESSPRQPHRASAASRFAELVSRCHEQWIQNHSPKFWRDRNTVFLPHPDEVLEVEDPESGEKRVEVPRERVAAVVRTPICITTKENDAATHFDVPDRKAFLSFARHLLHQKSLKLSSSTKSSAAAQVGNTMSAWSENSTSIALFDGRVRVNKRSIAEMEQIAGGDAATMRPKVVMTLVQSQRSLFHVLDESVVGALDFLAEFDAGRLRDASLDFLLHHTPRRRGSDVEETMPHTDGIDLLLDAALAHRIRSDGNATDGEVLTKLSASPRQFCTCGAIFVQDGRVPRGSAPNLMSTVRRSLLHNVNVPRLGCSLWRGGHCQSKALLHGAELWRQLHPLDGGKTSLRALLVLRSTSRLLLEADKVRRAIADTGFDVAVVTFDALDESRTFQPRDFDGNLIPHPSAADIVSIPDPQAQAHVVANAHLLIAVHGAALSWMVVVGGARPTSCGAAIELGHFGAPLRGRHNVYKVLANTSSLAFYDHVHPFDVRFFSHQATNDTITPAKISSLEQHRRARESLLAKRFPHQVRWFRDQAVSYDTAENGRLRTVLRRCRDRLQEPRDKCG